MITKEGKDGENERRKNAPEMAAQRCPVTSEVTSVNNQYDVLFSKANHLVLGARAIIQVAIPAYERKMIEIREGDAGILAIEHADFDGIERLALVTGGEIASTFDNPESVKLGHCKLIEEIMIGEDKLIHFSGVEMGQACTIILRGASEHVLDEAQRSLHDALCVLSQTVNDSRVLCGGGWPEMAIPTTIADNAGLDTAELISQLRAEHHKEVSNAGIDVLTGAARVFKSGLSYIFTLHQIVFVTVTWTFVFNSLETAT
ncbi:T-complex protein 1 subunit beta-like protein [Drosera capensis]